MSIARSVAITIPLDAEPGDTLSFEIDGTQLELVVPVGCQPGDVLQLQLAGTTDEGERGGDDDDDTGDNNNSNASCSNGDDHEEEHGDENEQDEVKTTTTTIVLSSGKKLILATDSGAVQEDDNDTKNTSTKNTTSNNSVCDGTHAMAWQSGNWLVECLTRHDAWRAMLQEECFQEHCTNDDDDDTNTTSRDMTTLSVLELGSGLGGLGMVFGYEILGGKTPWPLEAKSLVSSIRIVLTDVPTAMPLLQYNLQQNQHLFPPHVHVSARPLTWTVTQPNDHHDDDHHDTTTTTTSTTAPFDWIIGSDLLYNTESIPALVETMSRCLHPTRGRVLLAVRWRKPDLERRFFQQTMDRFLDWEWNVLVPPPPFDDNGNNNNNKYVSSIMCPLSWQDFGNAACERSNEYFHSTCIAVQDGSIKAICDITPTDVEAMSDEAFQAWERSHIQFYLGQPRTLSKETCGTKNKKQKVV